MKEGLLIFMGDYTMAQTNGEAWWILLGDPLEMKETTVYLE